MNQDGDTLNIRPLGPNLGQPPADPASSAEISAARARIEQITAKPEGDVIQPGQTVRFDHQPIAASAVTPVSPALQATKRQPLPNLLSSTPAAPLPAVSTPKGTKKRGLPSPIRPILTAIGTFILLFVIFRSEIIFSQIKYLTNHSQVTSSTTANTVEAISPDPTISIPKINVSAPVIYQPSIAEADILKSLQDGVVHYGTTALPGQNGNMVIVGHSSNDWWEPGNFKFVFVLLDKLAVGDQFSVDYQSKRYIYQVSNIKVVQPTDLSVLNPTSNPTATLITCTPPGTSWKRLVVTANQISPTPGAPTPTPTQTAQTATPILPGNAPSLTNQISRAWQNIVRGIGGIFGKTPTSQPAPAATQPSTTTPSGGALPSGL